MFYSVQLFYSGTKILSGSFDRHVKIWSAKGDCYVLFLVKVSPVIFRAVRAVEIKLLITEETSITTGPTVHIGLSSHHLSLSL